MVRPLRIFAHRGLFNAKPGVVENSASAFRAALKRRVLAGVETDVRFTADRVPVLMHDPTVERTTTSSAPLRVANLHFTDVKTLAMNDADRSPVVTLAQVLRLTRRLNKRLLLDIKPHCRRAYNDVVAWVKKYGMERSVALLVWHNKIKKDAGILTYRVFASHFITAQEFWQVKKAHFDGVSFKYKLTSEESRNSVVSAKKHGLLVNVYLEEALSPTHIRELKNKVSSITCSSWRS